MNLKHMALLLASTLLSGVPAPALAQSVEDLSNLSIEELVQVEVRSASRRAEPLSEAPTAIYVLTDSDIERSAATTLPEVLRLAPNLHVQRVDARQYAISARGFNGFETANKLLVLIDGRTVYTTLHSGVFWELHSRLLEDLHQIEVISGPGGTLFGPNAVNGVVTVATKLAQDTIGGLARATAGANERTAGLRYGLPIGDSGAVRFYANGFHREDMPGGAAADADDNIKGGQAGFRADFAAGNSNFTVQGDIFKTETDVIPGDGDQGHNILARWNYRLSGESDLQLQAYYDRVERRAVLVEDSFATFDVEGLIHTSQGRHKLVFGAGLRTTKDKFINNLNPFVLDPERQRLWIANAFAQDEISLSPELALIVGLKVEHSSFSGIDLLPNLRLAWQPNDKSLFWSAVSRAVRTPSRIDRQLVFPGLLEPATGFEAEKLIALEGGYRGRIGKSTTLSVSLFYNIYNDLRTTEFVSGNTIPIHLANGIKGNSYGLEAWATHQVTPSWRLHLGLSTLAEDFEVKQGHLDLGNLGSLGSNPDYQVTARSQLNLSDDVRFDVAVRAIDDLDNPHLDNYVEADARLGWQATEAIELYVAGNNLLHKTHAETADPVRGQRIERSVYGGTRIRF